MGTSDTVVTQNRCLVPGAEKSLTVTLEFMPAFGAIADLSALGFAFDRPLADQAAGPVEALETRSATDASRGLSTGRLSLSPQCGLRQR